MIAEPRNGTGPLGPPHNHDAELSVIGAILLSDTVLPALILDEHLTPEDFYRDAHARIYQAILHLHSTGDPVDHVTVKERLRQTGDLDRVGGEGTIDMLAGAVPNLANVRQYARIIRDNSILRNLLAATQDIQTRVYQRDTSTKELIDRAETAILRVSDLNHKQPFRPVGDMLHESLEALEQLSRGDTTLTGLTSGFADLDLMTGGFQPGNLIVLAARPSMGKSALMANFAEHAALNQDRAVALFSLEMSEQELAQRFVASQAAIKGDDLRRGQIKPRDWPHILEASNRLAASPLYVDDSSDLSVLDIRSKCRRLAQSHPTGLGLVLVDYLQLMRPSDQADNRTEQVGQISRGLKGLARELSVPVIALSQLNRGVEQRAEKRPVLSDLRDSGAIEQDADLVMFLYRDDYYDDASDREGIADLILAKHRNGGIGTVELTFQKQYPRFQSYAREDRYQPR